MPQQRCAGCSDRPACETQASFSPLGVREWRWCAGCAPAGESYSLSTGVAKRAPPADSEDAAAAGCCVCGGASRLRPTEAGWACASCIRRCRRHLCDAPCKLPATCATCRDTGCVGSMRAH
jgi:hypothetical protein